MAISNFNCYYKDYKNFLKNIEKKNIKYKPLIKNVLKKTGGRNNKGFITAYHRGGGVKQLYKNICFDYINLLKLKLINWVVVRIEYDSNRNSNIVLLRSYMQVKQNKLNNLWNNYFIYRLANENLKKGNLVTFFNEDYDEEIKENQFAQLFNVSTGSYIFNIEYQPCTKGKLIRSGGSKAKFLRKYNKYGLVSLPSGEKKIIIIILLCYYR